MQAELFAHWKDSLFGSRARMPRKSVEDMVTNSLWHLLQPHVIRNRGYECFKRMEDQDLNERVESQPLDESGDLA